MKHALEAYHIVIPYMANTVWYAAYALYDFIDRQSQNCWTMPLAAQGTFGLIWCIQSLLIFAFKGLRKTVRIN
jgi:hypothetical protein